MNINVPHIFSSDDYHDIEYVNSALKGTGLRATEIGFDGHLYVGVIHYGPIEQVDVPALCAKRKITLMADEDI